MTWQCDQNICFGTPGHEFDSLDNQQKNFNGGIRCLRTPTYQKANLSSILSLGIRGFKTGHLYININKYD